jgi:histidinol dehydrogenase
VVTLAEAEDLPAHGAALKARFGGAEPDKHSDWEIPAS